MLNSFRSIAGSFSAKILLLLLVISFGVWGVGDVLRTSGRNPTIATVGSVDITASDFLHSLHQETENLRHIMGENYSPDLLKNMNLSHWVLQKLINNELLKQESAAIGLLPSDSDVVRRIRSDQIFQDGKGNFDKKIFEARLQSINISEKAYVEQLRKDMSIGLLVDTLTAATPVSDAAIHTLLQAREEQRSVVLYNLTTSLINNVAQPDEAQIKAYYDAHTAEFTAPEYRNVSYVTITSADVPKDTKGSEDELKVMYNDRIDEFKRTERRTVEQLLYPTEDKARKAEGMLKAGKSLAEVAKELPVLNKDSISMGKIERSGLIEGAEDAVFSLSQGGTTAPIQSPFGWHIFHVTSIEPPSTLSFEEVRPALEKDLKQHGSDVALNKLANKLQDALAGGNTLAEASQELGLKVLSVGPLSREGQTPEGNPVKGLPNFDKFIETAFKTDEKSESPMMTAKGGVFYIVHVDSVTPERLRPIDEVKTLVISGCQKEERKKRLVKLASDISAKFANADDRNAIIAKYNLQPLPDSAIKHSTRAIGDIALPPALVNEVFSRKAQQGTTAYPGKNGNYLLAVVNNIIPANISENDTKFVTASADIKKSLETATQNEILDQYAHYLMTKYPVSVNEAAVQAVLK
jgi:peptidyl-prolyl cis-trans isomerase D